MNRPQEAKPLSANRGVLAGPLDALIFLLPLLAFYELASITRPDRVLAFDFLRRFFELFGRAGVWAPGLGVVVILLATQMASGRPWTIRWDRVAFMYGEALLLAVPLLALNWAIPLGGRAEAPDADALIHRLGLGVGAGVYEELVFRLIFISVTVMIGVDLLRFGRGPVALAAVILSALVFAAHHHQPIGMEPFDATRFAFRTIAGVYLALVFWYRGYGPAAGCHAAYNAALVITDYIRS
ncbi:MAG: CPBP family intramembrane glutamic endopeptidase [Phycisphaerae bacterium]